MNNIAVVSGTTGVGKSSLAHNLAAMQAIRGQRVRGIGLDRQCTLSLWNGIDLDPDDGALYVGDVLQRKRRIKTGEVDDRGKPVKRPVHFADVEWQTPIPRYTLIPEARELEYDMLKIAQMGGCAEVLKTEVRDASPVDTNWFDTPGGANPLSLAALAAADWIIVVVCPTPKGVQIGETLQWIEEMQEDGKTQAELVGIVPNIVPAVREGGAYQDVMDQLNAPAEEGGYADMLLPAIRKQHYEITAFAMSRPLAAAFPRAEITADYEDLLKDLDRRGVTK
ncbi:ParA family protein [Saccharopolyspora sp. K220]|uniref:ParA family protein n=1 Tax=Saccharopolyspora soli TaxID=2926618 RepID=UPI001F5A88CE|nr:AAA family ATPase [Saccharopolyspora soli]MCI2423893.1 ParA family protein [Saccharopolyspora soli]